MTFWKRIDKHRAGIQYFQFIPMVGYDQSMYRTTCLITLFLSVLSACASMKAGDEFPFVLENHVLAGKIWDVKSGKFVGKQRLVEEIRHNKFILLGETHDNRIHHQGQAWIINNLNKSGFSALVAFEMINSAQGELIKNKEYRESSALIEDLNQVKNTWRYESRYKPVFDSVLGAHYSLYPASMDKKSIMTIVMKGQQSVPADIQYALEKNPLSEAQNQALKEEIRISHCGMSNPEMTRAMMLTQRVKDAVMAKRLMRDSDEEKRVLVAGSGHTRKDRGVPMYITSEYRNDGIISIVWIEVAKGLNSVEEYAERWDSKKLPYDYVWFTARVDRPDPCKEFRHHMQIKQQDKDKGLNKMDDSRNSGDSN